MLSHHTICCHAQHSRRSQLKQTGCIGIWAIRAKRRVWNHSAYCLQIYSIKNDETVMFMLHCLCYTISINKSTLARQRLPEVAHFTVFTLHKHYKITSYRRVCAVGTESAHPTMWRHAFLLLMLLSPRGIENNFSSIFVRLWQPNAPQPCIVLACHVTEAEFRHRIPVSVEASGTLFWFTTKMQQRCAKYFLLT